MAIAVSTDSAKRALLERLVDDAALFPPAELPMRAALRHHARLRESAYWWIAGRFVVPASRLDELASVRDSAQALELSVILDSAVSGAKGDTVRADLHRIDRVIGSAGITVASRGTARAGRRPRPSRAHADRVRDRAALAVRARVVLVRTVVQRRLDDPAGRGARRRSPPCAVPRRRT